MSGSWSRNALKGSIARLLLAGALALAAAPAFAQNAIVTENQLPGNPASQWDISGSGDPSIQGFATDISVNVGGTVHFKIDTDAAAYTIAIYRLGWYGGDGARLVGSGVITATLPQNQPAPLTDGATGLVDCGNWAESAHWDVPANAVSGIYIAKLTRTDTNGASHIAFVVRDDASHSDLMVQTSDATWQAYNSYGGNSLYGGSAPFPSGHAAKVSYNRPFITRGGPSEDWLFNAEYPMVRWLESNGYDVSYTTDVDTDRRGNLILNHKVFMSSGHDEYWSAGARNNVVAARNAGVHLAFFSGNEIYWKTRYEPSIDGSNTDYRTLVCYKEGTLGEIACGTKCDPLAGVWTGLWRDGCAPTYAPNDACLPENSLSGQISWDGSTGAIQVPDTYKNLRFWRNTAVATLGSGQTATLTAGSLGYEWDYHQFDAFYPARRILLSTTVFNGKTHHLSLYRADSGALVFGAGTVQWAWGLDGTHDRGSDPPSLTMQQATVNLFADMGVSAGSLQAGLVQGTASSDTQAPASVIGFPLDGASLPSGTPVTITGTANDVGGGTVAGVEVSVDGGATWSAAAGAASWSFVWTPGPEGPATIKSRAFDDTGNLELAGASGPNVIAVTVTAAVPPTCPCTVFQPTDTPGGQFNDGQAINVGMKFRTTVDGFVTGVRFYKGAANTGVHTGLLWSSAGTLLAQAVFTGESASGWQEVAFASPVAVTAGTTYMVAYHSAGGGYAANDAYFTSAVVNGPLRALAFGEDGPNGMYVYGSSPTFPTQSFQTSNYWVDVVFNTAVGPDETPPTVVAISPTANATGVPAGVSVTATFSEAIDAATVSGSTFELRDPSNVLVPAAVTYSGSLRMATLAPNAALAYSTTYIATVKGGGTDPRIKDLAGNALASNQTWSFTTSAPPPPPPTEGPGGPILVISAAANPFSRYPVEILRAEGLNEFTAMDISLVDAPTLGAHDVVILGDIPLTAAQVTMLTDWTNAGGTLIAFRPDKQLAGLMGLTDANGTLADKYLLVNTASGPGVGIVGQTIQYHGTADLYTLNGATSLAMLYSNAAVATPNPAVTTRAVGSNGGRAIAFTYDLARSVVYTRQGNPAWAGQKRDGQIEPIRSDDLYFGGAEPDWVDLNKVAIPQADEQQRLLANAILQGSLHRMPLPRFWYLPKGLKAAIVMTGDNHGDGGMACRFDVYRNQSPANCSVDDWECVRATGYEYVGSGFTNAQAMFYNNLGFEVAVHINTNCARATPSQYEAFVSDQLATFASVLPGVPAPVSNRNHCIAWSDWSSVAEVEAAHGIRLDTNYYYWPAAWVQNRSGMFTGSGIPMRFAKMDGTLIDCYQASTEMPDESGESFPAFCDQLLDRANGPEGYYGVFTTNMHFDSCPHAGSDAIVASAQARGVPVVSAKQMLTWLDGRNGSSFGSLAWNGNQLTFTIAAAAGSRNLQAMLPTSSAGGQLTGLTLNGSPVAFTTQTIKGMQYAFFPAAAGSYAAQYMVDTTAPVISAVTATPHDDGTATVTWTTDEPSDSRVDFGTAQGSLTLNVSDAALVTSHSLIVSGLSASTVYYYRVTSKDAADNSATEPVVTSDPLSFTTPAPVCFQDRTTSDFAAGTTGTSTSVVTMADGEVTLRAAAAAEFAVLPPTTEWQTFPWSAGGTASVSGGQLSVDGARFNTEPVTATYGPGSSVEFVATFNAVRLQHIGFGAGDDGIATGSIFNTAPWAIFSTGPGSQLQARVNISGTLIDYNIPLALLGAPHKYRIDWNPASVDFYVDDALVHTESATIAGPMRVAIADYDVGGAGVSVDWIHVSPYASAGSFASRVFDGGSSPSWGLMSWNAALPSGTSLQMFARQGNTPTPDGSWTSYVAIASSGTAVGGSARYIQYRADLATSVAAHTPVLQDVHVTCATGPDVTPPVISGITATPGGGGTTAVIAWNTDELATSRVDYGLAQGSLPFNVTSTAMVGTHALTLTDLTPNTVYYFRVTSTDAANNSATEPVVANPPLTFTSQSAPCIVQSTSADFGAGTPGTATYVSETSDGEVILKPAEGAEFSGTALPAGWSATNYGGGGSAVVGGGHVGVDGAYVAPATTYTAGRSVEFVATFDATAGGQHIGFGVDLNAAPWAIFSTHGGGVLEARTNPGSETNETIPGSWLGAPHRFRIDWNPTSVVYSIDGTVVTTHALTISAAMRPIVSDGPVGGNPLQADWIRMTPYPGSGSYLSRVFDSGGATTWGAASWTSSTPSGAALAMLARAGNTPTPDGSWTAFTPIATSGSSIGASGRYLQYRADLSTSDAGATPELRDVSIVCTTTTDVTPPVISGVVAVSANDGLSATVGWSTDEQSTSRVDYGTAPGSLTLNVSSASLTTSHMLTLPGLTPGTAYYYRVTSVDAFANSSTSPTPPSTLNFTTQSPPCAVDVTSADFAAGTTGGATYVSETVDGEVILQPADGAEFSGFTLPSGWTSAPWASGGTVTVGGGVVTVDGAAASTIGSFAPLRSMEFIATFTAANFQNVGFAATGAFASPWVTIGEGTVTGGVYARRDDGGDVLLSATALGAPHRYRIDWNATTFVFYIDGVQVATMAKTVSTNMVPIISDFTVGGPVLTVDWLRMTPYAASGSYTSRVFDSGGVTTWGLASWTSSLPAGTSLAMSARRGSTPVPDGTWTSFIAIPSSGSNIGGSGRYLQYRADLATTDGTVTPELRDVSIQCVSTPDVTPPVISAVAAAPASDGLSAQVTWTTDEPATSRVDYGTSPGSLTLNVSSPAPVVSHGLTLPGLSAGVTYYYRVTSVDGSANSASSPTPPGTASFVTPSVCLTDQTASDFSLGTLTSTYVSTTTDGEVMLAPTLGSEFSGTTLPSGWSSVLWSNGAAGGATVSGGNVSVDGGRLSTTSTTGFSSGRVLEFVATFVNTGFQHVGFGAGDNTIGSTGMFASAGNSWAMFSTASGGALFARLNNAGSTSDVNLGPSYLGGSHLYRIEWKSSPDSVIWLIDGASVRRTAVTIAATMRPGISDFTAGGAVLLVNWLRMSPYASSGSFVSRVFDSGGPSSWGSANWTATVPAGTTLAMSVRGGNTATPDGTWSAYQLVASSGASVSLCSRYVQYMAEMTTSVPASTPVLQSFSMTCSPAPPAGPAVSTLTASLASGNDASGRMKVALAWTGSTGSVSVYRKGYGDYPLYRSGVGGVPATPASPGAAQAAGWALTSITASGQTDQAPSRDFWYYVLFQSDACGNSSPPSNVAALPGYLLGDFSNGATPCAGDNVVNGADVSLLGAHYGAPISGPSDPLACLDVGPTTDFTTLGRPQPDAVLEFEDLVMVALDYTGGVGPVAARPAERPAAATGNGVSLRIPAMPAVGGTFDVGIDATGAGNLQALGVDLGFDPAVVQQVSVDPGELLARQNAPALALSSRPGRIDVALLGHGATLFGSGGLAVVRFRVIAEGDAKLGIRSVDARDASNRKVSLGPVAVTPPSLPSRTELSRAYPNPFRQSLTVDFALRTAQNVRLAIYDVAGRKVRTLLDESMDAGRRTVTWDGRGDSGAMLSPGYFIVRLQTQEGIQSRPVWLVR